MPSAGAWARGKLAAEEIIGQHKEANSGKYPETTAVTLWGLDAIKTRGKLGVGCSRGNANSPNAFRLSLCTSET